MRRFLPLIFLTLLQPFTFSQHKNFEQVLDFSLSYRGLTRSDITIPVDYFNAGEKSPTNGTQLVLPLVRDMLNNPLNAINWTDSVMQWCTISEKELIIKLWGFLIPQFYNKTEKLNNTDISYRFDDEYNKIWKNQPRSFSELSERIYEYLKARKKWNAFSSIPQEDILFLQKNLFIIFDESDDDESNTDIFKYNQDRDSSIIKSKGIVQILNKFFNAEKIFQDSQKDLNFRNNIIKFISEYKSTQDETDYIDNQNIRGSFFVYDELSDIRIAIGDSGRNEYHGWFDFIIDLGGNDYYQIEKDKQSTKNFSCIIDLSGDDYYAAKSNFALAGGLFSSSFIFDKEGDDIYEATGYGNLGASIGGIGVLYDEKGNDTYRGLSFSIGAGCFGIGLLMDKEGNDFYIANSYSQGFGMTSGIGCIIDNKGNDSYLTDSRSLDIGRYNDHYLSMCQGFGLGLRPYYGGGVGLIIEAEGNDIYNTDIYGQGGGYWYGLGAVLDKSGHDKYNSYQYSQGSGIHIAVGLLKDYDGWDFYTSNGVSQGCGHDYGFGFLWDVKGNDNYSAYSLSQGAGNANGIGLLIDESGRDGYLNKEPGNSRGYGNPRREFGSLGIFLDVSGTDFYSVAGLDSTINNSSTWGVSDDYFFIDLPEQFSGDNFKVEVDSLNGIQGVPYKTEQYFIIAKTIEPRFSKWQEYGFRKLIEDSIKTSEYLLSKLETDDHRDVQVMRVLITKIPYAIADAIITLLDRFKRKEIHLEPKELSLICYLMGESKGQIFKEDLLELTYNENIRVKSTAVNALGKLKIDSTDGNFIIEISKRLIELTNEYSPYKLFNKDLAFAFKNYKRDENIPSLIKLLSNDYYGARFLASECLRLYKDSYFSYLNDDLIIEFAQSDVSTYALLTSLSNLKDDYFRIAVDKILSNRISEPVKLFAVTLLESRMSTENIEFQDWLILKINELNEGSLLNKKPAR